MLTIRKDQIQAFEKVFLRNFEKEIYTHLRESMTDFVESMDDKTLLEFVQEKIKKGESYGIETRYDLRRFIECVLMLHSDSENLEELPWVSAILFNQDISGTEKMDALVKESLMRPAEINNG
jgi:hypothetical protein